MIDAPWPGGPPHLSVLCGYAYLLQHPMVWRILCGASEGGRDDVSMQRAVSVCRKCECVMAGVNCLVLECHGSLMWCCVPACGSIERKRCTERTLMAAAMKCSTRTKHGVWRSIESLTMRSRAVRTSTPESHFQPIRRRKGLRTRAIRSSF